MSCEMQLRRGGQLVMKTWDPDKKDYVENIIDNEDIVFHLHDTICFGPGITLRDLFLLIRKDLPLFCMTTGYPYLDDFIEEALAPTVEHEKKDISAVRFKWIAIVDKNEFLCFTDLHAIGEEITYPIALCPINSLTVYPFILDTNFEVHSIIDNNSKLLFKTNRQFTLMQLIKGVSDEIGFLGPPEVREFASETIRNQIVEAKNDGIYDYNQIENKLDTPEVIIAKRPCKKCGEDARSLEFGKPKSLCGKCFKKTKEN